MKKRFFDELRTLLIILWMAWTVYAGFTFFGSMYKYTVVSDWGLWVKVTIWLFAIPTLLLLVGLILSKRGKSFLLCLCCVMFCIALVVGFIHGAMQLTFAPVFSSYTDDVRNFGVYDKEVQTYLDSDKVVRAELIIEEASAFPNRIPQYATDVKYCYFYQNSSFEEFYIAVAWTCPVEDFNNISKVFSQYTNISKTNNISVYHFPNYSDKDDYYVIPSAIILDRETCRIAYVTADWGALRNNYLPISIDEAFTHPF